MGSLKSQSELIVASNLNFAGSFRKLAQHCPGGEVHSEGQVLGFVTGVPISMFNGCLVLERSTATDLAAVAAWVAAKALPHLIWIDERIEPARDKSGLPDGFVRSPWTLPGMVMQSSAEPPRPGTGVTVASVAATDLAEFVGVFVEGGLPAALAEMLFTPAFAADPDVQLFIARLDGRSVGTAMAIRTGDVAGVYAVGTLERARHHGVGAAATWAAVSAGQAWGCNTIVLQSSEMGLPVYTAMGFRTVTRYAIYERPPKR